MFERFTERARRAVVLAQDEARAFKHNHIGTEHLLLGLLSEEEGLAARVLESLDVTLEAVREQVGLIVGRGDETVSGQIPFTPRSKKVLELALREALSLGHNYIGTEHILLGLIRENEGVATRILLGFGADAEKVRNRIIDLVPALGRSLAMPRPSPGPARRAPVTPSTWEYLVEHWPAEERAPRTERLSTLGAERWQLAAVLPGPETSEWVFQRPARPSRWTTAILGSSWTQSNRALRVGQLERSLEEAEQGALEAHAGAYVTAIGAVKEQLELLIARLGKVSERASEQDPTFDDLIEMVRSEKESAIASQDFQRAASMRDIERWIARLLASVTELFSGHQASG